jgi:hypothetical protein
MRPERRFDRELWLWLGTGLLALGCSLAGIEAAVSAGRVRLTLWTSGPMLGAYVLIALALTCFVAGVREGRLPLSPRPAASSDDELNMAAPAATAPAPESLPRGAGYGAPPAGGAIEVMTAFTIEADLDALVEIAATGILAQDAEVCVSTVRSWASSAEMTIRVRCAPAWAARFAAAGYGMAPREELTAKIEFIHDKLVPKVRDGWFSPRQPATPGIKQQATK